MDRRHHDIRAPFPREPWLTSAAERKRICAWQTAHRQNSFAVADVPAGIGIAKKILVTLGEKKAVEESDRGRDERHVRRKPSRSASTRIGQVLRRGSADARQVSRDALVKADDASRQLINRGNQSEPNCGNDERVFHEVLPLLIANESDNECFHVLSPVTGR